MYIYQHKIGALSFVTHSSSRVKSLEKEQMRRYFSDEKNGEIRIFLQSVVAEEMNSVEWSDNLRLKLHQCTLPPHLGQGVQIFPACYIGAFDPSLRDFYKLGSTQDYLPLMSAPQVKRKLEIAALHPEDVFLVCHAFSIEIIDLALQEAYIFFAEPMSFVWWDRPQYYIVDDAIRRLFCAFMPARGAFSLHSSAVIRNGRAALMVAADGGGKSTAARLCTDGVVLCDDRNILRLHDDGPRVHSTPWGPISSGPLSAPLGGVFLLEKASAFDIAPLSKRDLMAFLWQDNSFLWMQLPVHHRVRAYDDLAAMIHSVPSFRLRFPRDSIDWSVIDAAIQGR